MGDVYCMWSRDKAHSLCPLQLSMFLYISRIGEYRQGSFPHAKDHREEGVRNEVLPSLKCFDLGMKGLVVRKLDTEIAVCLVSGSTPELCVGGRPGFRAGDPASAAAH
jgi:hypothetical protein